MQSSTSIEIECPILTDEQLDELLTLLEEMDSERLRKDVWEIVKSPNSCIIRVNGNSIDCDTAESVRSTVLEDFLEKFFKNQKCYVEVKYLQMNADGAYEWNAYIEDGQVTYEDRTEIYSNEFWCEECCNYFDIDYDEEDNECHFNSKGKPQECETDVICPHCGEKYIRQHNWLVQREIDEL